MVFTHVDDLLITCVEESVIDEVIQSLNEKFGRVNAHNGPVIDYLGMIMDFSNQGVVTVSMKPMVEAILEEMNIQEAVVTPALANLFKPRDDSLPLADDLKDIFHSIVAKLLYLAKRGRPDILTAVSYLTTRVKGPTTDDWNKLIRVLKYLYGSKDSYLSLSTNGGIIIQAFIDASFAVHDDGKGHTGVSMSLGRGTIYNKSSKQKLVSKSSTESELIGIADGLPIVIWTRNFLISQGYSVEEAITYQDNKSTIFSAEKGKPSSSRTKHINVRYFFVRDRIDKKEVKLVYLPTEEMISDFFTKPLQGSLFLRLRDKILGVENIKVN